MNPFEKIERKRERTTAYECSEKIKNADLILLIFLEN